MKKFKLSLIIVMCAVLLLFLCSCGTKEAITGSGFASYMKSQKFIVTDASNEFQKDNAIKKAYTASDKDKKYSVFFYKVDTNKHAKVLYKNLVGTYESVSDSSLDVDKSRGTNYEKYKLETNGLFVMTCRVENTVLSIACSSDNKDKAKDVFSDLKY